MSVNDDRTIRIFDTTLRDGEQSPGASLNMAEKVEIAKALEVMGVDVIEAGFPIASPGDFDAVQAVSDAVRAPIVCGLARAMEKDVARAAEAVKRAAKRRVHLFCATSEIHMKYKLKKTRDEVIRMSVDHVKFARTLVDDVEFSAEDASRSDPGFLAEVIAAVIDAGAGTVNIPDTVGYSLPEHYSAIISGLRARVPNIDRAIVSVHCHNDLGLAVANSLAAVQAGARQVECTVNGLGERAGNCSMEEFVMALKVRHDHYGLRTNIDTRRIYPVSRMVSSLTGIHVQRNKAIVGENAFAHESGIHQHGVLANPDTYEIMKPEDVGITENKLVLGKHSGRHAFRDRLTQLGHTLDDAQIDKAFEVFKVLADKKKDIFDEDLDAIVEEMTAGATPKVWELIGLQTTAGSGVIPTATVRLKNASGDEVIDAATGDGPVDAVYSAIQRICGVNAKLTDWQIRALTGGKDAQGEVSLEIEAEAEGRRCRGRAVSTDIIEASAKAYLSAINRLLHMKK
jgi:2-isopropylmalate synthase